MYVALLKVTGTAAFLAAVTDPQWAVTINTLLLVVLAVVNIRHERSVSAARLEIQDASRIAKELGAHIRSQGGLPLASGTDGTDGTGTPGTTPPPTHRGHSIVPEVPR